MKTMKKLLEKIADILAATAFAEIEGSEAVRDMMLNYKEHGVKGAKGSIFAAIAYAEAGDFETAKQLMDSGREQPALRPVCRLNNKDMRLVRV